MTKRIIALFLALILTVGLLPTVALAAGETAGADDSAPAAEPITNPEPQTANGVTLSKTATKNQDGTYTIRMEAYATGSATTTETKTEVPTDIILVLDRSGSMGTNKMGKTEYNKYRNSRNEDLYSNKDNLFYKLTDGSYVKVEVKKEEQTGYSPYRERTTNSKYYDASHGRDAVTLYAQIEETNYQKVTVSREWKQDSDGWRWRNFYTYTLDNGTKIALDSKGSDTVPTFTGVTSQVLYTKSTQNVYTYTYTDAEGKLQTIGTSTGDRTEFTVADLYAQWVNSNDGETRMQALMNAASNFVDSVAKKAAGTDGKTVEHRIAVVSFASNATNDTNGFKNMTNTSDVNSVRNTIKNLTANGGTLVDEGIKTANNLFDANPITDSEKRNRVMIVFTDGAPGEYGNWKSASVKTANNAISAANTTKNTYNATVFTIGIFAGAKNELPLPDYTASTYDYYWGEVSPSEANQIKNSNRFMHLVSTNYPTATNINTTGEQNSKTGYYLTASDSAALNNVFQQISDQIQNVTTTDLDASAVVTDTVGESFSFAGTAQSYAVKVAAFEELENGQYTFSSNETAFTNANVTVENNTISVSNFNFKDEWCGYDTNNGTQTPHGRKLIIELTVAADAAGCDTASIPTNNGNAKILDKDEKSAVEITSPTVQGYQVTYNEGTDDTTVANMPEPSKYFINATMVASKEPTRAGYTFAGWKMTGDTTEKTYNAGGSISFNGSDVELVAQWTAKTLEVNLGEFVKKQFTMTEDKELPNSGEEFKVTVTQTKPAAAEGATAPSYNGTVTVQKDGTYDFTFTTNPTLTYGVEYEFSVSEVPGTNTSIRYDNGSYTLSLKLQEVTENGKKKIVAVGSTVTVQNSYIETYILSYDRNEGTGEVPTDTTNYTSGQTATLKFGNIPTHADDADGNKIVFLGWSAEKDTTIHETEPSNLIYEIQMTENKTVYAVWGYDKNNNGNPDFYDATATYKIVNGTWNGTVDTQTETVKVKIMGPDGKWTATNNKLQNIPSTTTVTPSTGYTSTGSWDVTPTSAEPFTQDKTYTYTLQKLNEATFDLNTLITKTFKKDPNRESEDIPAGTYTFTAEIYSTNDDFLPNPSVDPVIGTAKLTGAAENVPFDFGNSRYPKLTAGKHYYLVRETAGTVRGITYDDTVYHLTIDVPEENTTSPSVKIEKVSLVSTQSAGATEFEEKITFTNTYYEEPAPNTVTFDPSEYVKKYFVSEYGQQTTETFTAHVKIYEQLRYGPTSIEEESAPVVFAASSNEKLIADLKGTVTLKTGESKNFTFDQTASLEVWKTYRLEVYEEPGTNPYVEYDDSVYDTTTIQVVIWEDGSSTIYTDRTGDTYHVLDVFDFFNYYTAQDEYIPIIIPTIINKDTGMLNKTDHFAYVIGYPDGTVHPNGQITRAEVATIFFRLLKDEVRDGAFTTSNSYSDVAYGKWYNNPISTMSALGIITGYPDGTFKPDKPITRAEFAAIAARFDETQYGKSATFSDVIGHWAANEIGIAYANEWIKGYPDGTFKPDQNITRAEAMTMINRVLERKPESPSDLLTDMNKWTDNMDTSKWYYLDVQEATNSHAYTRKTFNYELWRQMLTDPDWSRYER